MKFIAPIYISRWRGSDSTGCFGWCTQGQNLNLSSQESPTPTIILPHVQWKKDTYINIPYSFVFTQRQEDFKDEDAKEESKGICGPDMWYSPKGKSIPCAILIVILWIVFLPFVIIFGFSVLLWLCLSKCYTYFFMAGLQSSRNVEGPN